MLKPRYVFYLLLFILLCCKKPYSPPASSTPNSYLVVEGIINSGNDSTVIILSKTVQLTSKTIYNPVLGATVTVEGEQNGVYYLIDNTNSGHYRSLYSLNLSPSQKYRLRIVNGNRQYLSDFVAAKLTPPIDSVGYNILNGDVNVYVNTHDPANNTRYYRWDYDETWQFHSKYQSAFVADTVLDMVVPRTPEQQVYNCFGNDVSPNVIINSTAQLAKDIVYQNSVVQIPLSSEKVETRYSILLRQYALTQEAFQYYQALKKNTEQLGSIFDAQPSELTGNIHCTTDPGEPVLGYVAACNIQSKRIFISHSDLPGDVQTIYPYDCEVDTAMDAYDTFIVKPVSVVPILAAKKGYSYSSIPCVDCTFRGVTKAPPWW
jgi:hypothetical protein